ncbi:adenylate cyclase [Striga asiatica]|uniref:Adenylate cyclase n=1 Tax=Striga asiatica TaxID=4170 RepID=A0A5A7P3N8_STRAF|nr:adenylate cyclase [Striga asiatica]
MEVEVKLRLASFAAHERLSAVLSPFHRRTHFQQNLFFDGSNAELSSALAVLRLRFYDLDSRCVLSLKSKPRISGGISRIEEQEEPIDPTFGRHCTAEPRYLFQIESSDIMRRVRDEFGIGDNGLVCLGGFRNVRGVYEWNGLRLEVDETDYGFGTCYEVECESSEPERAKDLIEELLRSNGVEYRYSTVSKFVIFRAGNLPD